ncbi:MAG: hypothetical protein FJZ57_04885 [Chlamydiae bacterium]|nr:hypothetical protein [Chlamydiota bacterium]
MSSIKQSPLDAFLHRDLKSGSMLDNSLYGIGRNTNGEFGLNNATGYTNYTLTGSQNVVDVWCSQGYLQLKSDGSLFATGYNTYGELGQGDIIYRSSPTQIPGVWDSFINDNGGQYHNGFAYKSDGSLWGWGYNAFGVLLTNNIFPRSSPVQVFAAGTYSKVSSSHSNLQLLKSDGTMWGVGYNAYGGLGQVTDIVNRSSPVQMGTDTNWTDTASGHYFSLGLKNDGTLWGWGYNLYGELGQGDIVPRSSPVQIPGSWSDIGADIHVSYARKTTDNKIYMWGYNSVGNFGKENANPRSSPVLLGSDGNWKSVRTGYTYVTYMTDYNDNLWGAGSNGSYQLNPDGIPRSAPIQITTHGSVEKFSAGVSGAFVLEANNNLLGNLTSDPLTDQLYSRI